MKGLNAWFMTSRYFRWISTSAQYTRAPSTIIASCENKKVKMREPAEQIIASTGVF